MSDTVLVSETHTAAKVNEGIVDFLKSWLFAVEVHHITQGAERWLPLDALFDAGPDTLVFGLQHKALYRRDSQPQATIEQPHPTGDDRWKISDRQGELIQDFSWIHLALCELAHRLCGNQALHLTFFLKEWPERRYLQSANTSILHRHEMSRLVGMHPLSYETTSIAQRWMDFFWTLQQGNAGVRPGNAAEAARIFEAAIIAALDGEELANAIEIEDLSLTLIAVNFSSKHALVYSSTIGDAA